MRFDFDPLAPGATLDACADAVARAFPDVNEISTEALARLIDEGRPPVLLDVREKAEWDVSRLPGAQRVAPGTLPSPPPVGPVVCYCAVGLRSARLAEALRRAGVSGVTNLRGGIFAWAQAGGPLVGAKGPTAEVHPFDARWGKLLGKIR